MNPIDIRITRARRVPCRPKDHVYKPSPLKNLIIVTPLTGRAERLIN